MPEDKKPLFDLDNDTLKQGDAVVQVRDPRLACCMIAVGIPLRRDPPYTHIRTKDGRDIWTFHFYPSDQDGEVTAHECIGAYKRDIEFINENPLHPFSFALATIKTWEQMQHHMNEVDPIPFLAFRSYADDGTPATVLVREGSPRHRGAVNRGMKRL